MIEWQESDSQIYSANYKNCELTVWEYVGGVWGWKVWGVERECYIINSITDADTKEQAMQLCETAAYLYDRLKQLP